MKPKKVGRAFMNNNMLINISIEVITAFNSKQTLELTELFDRIL